MLLKSYTIKPGSTLQGSRDPLMKTPHYFRIVQILEKLVASGITRTFPGNCISTCEVFQSILAQAGINSTMMEVQLMITRQGDQEEFLFVGYDGQSFSGSVDTHVVLITETDQPLLIDLSLGHVLPPDRCFVIERLDDPNRAEILLEMQVENLSMVYTKKKVPRLASLHQTNVVKRALEEHKMKRDFGLIRILALLAVSIGCINFVANSILIILKMIYP